jgi:hypothetical protein
MGNPSATGEEPASNNHLHSMMSTAMLIRHAIVTEVDSMLVIWRRNGRKLETAITVIEIFNPRIGRRDRTRTRGHSPNQHLQR